MHMAFFHSASFNCGIVMKAKEMAYNMQRCHSFLVPGCGGGMPLEKDLREDREQHSWNFGWAHFWLGFGHSWHFITAKTTHLVWKDLEFKSLSRERCWLTHPLMAWGDARGGWLWPTAPYAFVAGTPASMHISFDPLKIVQSWNPDAGGHPPIRGWGGGSSRKYSLNCRASKNG